MGLFSKKHVVVPEEIDLRDQAPAPAPFEFGFPTRCPTCGGRGYLDHLDMQRRVQYEHCPVDFAKWELAEHEVLALNA